MCRFLTAFFVCLSLVTTADAAVFQYRQPVETDRGQRDAFLWIPPMAEQIRGVVMCGMTLMEREAVQDARIREACTEQDLAIVFLKCGLGAIDPPMLLENFARLSGYPELACAPILFVGHSAGGPQAKSLAIRMPERCFGLVQYRGGVPGGTESVPPGIPTLMMIGQFDEFGGTMRDANGREKWEGGRDAMAMFRSADERNLGSLVVEPGAGHFAWSDRNAAYLSLFIRKAAQTRILASWPIDATRLVELLQIDPASGWLTDLNVSSPTPSEPATYETYAGDRLKAAWHFDQEMARATVAYHAGGFGKKDQFIQWTDPFWVDAGTRFFFTKPTWVDDGQTIEVHPVYADVYPGQHNGNGPRWLTAGQPVGHSDAAIRVRRVGGPLVVSGANRLRVQFDNLAPATENARMTFLACSDGDDQYRSTEQVGMMPRGFKGHTKGAMQTLTFPPLGDVKADGKPVKLDANSSSGLPVEYYVAYGPAVIERGKLQISEVPVRAKYPISVRIVAYQYGRGIEPLVQTAVPVEQTIRLLKP